MEYTSEESKEESSRAALVRSEEWNIGCFPVYAHNGEVLPEIPDYFRAGHSLDFIPYDTTATTTSAPGALYLFGGYSGSQELYILHNAHKLGTPHQEHSDVRWQKASVNGVKGRGGHISFLHNSQLYIHGGYTPESAMLGDIFAITPTEDDSVFEGTPLQYKGLAQNVERRWHCGVFVDERLIVHGGWNDGGPLSDMLMLPWDSMKWSSVELSGEAPSPRRWHSLTALNNNPRQQLLYGGYNGVRTHLFSDFYLMNLESQQWVRLDTSGTLPEGRARHSLLPLPDGKTMLLMGGLANHKSIERDLFILHTDDMKWSQVDKKTAGPLFPALRCAHKAVFVREHGIVVAGGYVQDFVEHFVYLDVRMLH